MTVIKQDRALEHCLEVPLPYQSLHYNSFEVGCDMPLASEITQCECGKAIDRRISFLHVSLVADLHSQVNPMPVSGVIACVH